MNNKKWIFLSIVLVVIALIFIKKIPDVKNKTSKSITTSSKINIGFPIQSLDAAPLIIAYQNGYFKDQGLDVSLLHLQSAEGALAVGSGKVDLDVTGATRLFGPIEKGSPVKILSYMGSMSSYLFVRPDSNIKTLKDLEGKKVSLGPAGSSRLRAKYFFEKEGVDLNKITFIDIEKMYLPMALMDKKEIDAALIDEPAYVNKAKEQGAVVLPYWYEKKYDNQPNGSSIAVNTNYLKNNEENVKKFYLAMIQAHRYFKKNPFESANIVTKYLKDNTNGAMDIKPDYFLKQLEEGSLRYILWEDVTPIVDFAKVSYDMKLSERILSADELYDFRFKNILEAAQNEIYGTKTN